MVCLSFSFGFGIGIGIERVGDFWVRFDGISYAIGWNLINRVDAEMRRNWI